MLAMSAAAAAAAAAAEDALDPSDLDCDSVPRSHSELTRVVVICKRG